VAAPHENGTGPETKRRGGPAPRLGRCLPMEFVHDRQGIS
jgi:hypothetical protein